MPAREEPCDGIALPAHRELRRHRQPAHGRAGGDGRLHRLALPAALRFPERLRRHPGRPQGRALPHRPGRRRLPPQAVLLAGHRHPRHSLPARRRRGRGRGLHAGRWHRHGAGRADPAESASSAARLPFHLECRPAFDYARAAHEMPPRRARRPLRRAGAEPRPGRPRAAAARRRRRGRRLHARGRGEGHVRPAPPRSRGPSPAAAPASARRRSCSATPSPTGGAGSRSAPTPAAGGRWSTAPP